MKISLRKRHLIPFILIISILVLLGVIFIEIIKYERNNTKNWQMKDLENHSDSLSYAIQYYFSSYITYLDLVSYYFGKNNKIPTNEDLKNIYNNSQIDGIDILNLCFINNKGTMLSIYPNIYYDEIGTNYSFRNYFKKAQKTDKAVISAPLSNFMPDRKKNKIETYNAVIMLKPVINSIGKRLGYIQLDINIKDIKGFINLDKYSIDKYSIDKESFDLFLYEFHDYNAIYESADSVISKNELFNTFKINSKSNDISGSADIVLFGNKYFIAFNKISIADNNFILFTILPYKDSITLKANQSLQLFLLALYFTIILILFAMLIFYNKIILKKYIKEIHKLEIIIDEKNKNEELKRISESEFFVNMKEKVNQIKK